MVLRVGTLRRPVDRRANRKAERRHCRQELHEPLVLPCSAIRRHRKAGARFAVTRGLHFEIRDPFGKVRELSFDTTELLWIGREATCQIAIFAPNVSRWHASIERVPEGLKITDASL